MRGDAHAHTIEGFFLIFKHGMKGVYQHCGDRHLHRYLAEFDFRYSNRVAPGVDNVMRTMRSIKGAEGKRLTYNQSVERGRLKRELGRAKLRLILAPINGPSSRS